MTDAAVAPGAARLGALASGGFSTDEVNQYRDQTSGTMSAAGFNQEEINNYWGVKTPDMSGVQAVAAAAKPEASTLSPDNPAMRSELVGSYERGETKNPLEFAQAALRAILPVIAGGIKRMENPGSAFSNPVESLENAYKEVGLGDVGGALEQGSTQLAAKYVAPFISDETAQKLIDSGVLPPNGGTPLPPNAAPVARFVHGLSEGLSPITTPLMAPFQVESALFSAPFTKVQTAAENAVPSAYASLPGDVANLALSGLAAFGLKAGVHSLETPPKAQDFANGGAIFAGQSAVGEAQVAAVLRNVFKERNIHPTQVVADAQSNSTIPQDLAAGKTPKAYIPPRPFITETKTPSVLEQQMADLEKQLDSGKGNPDEIRAQMDKLADQRIIELSAKPIPGNETHAPQAAGAGYQMLKPSDLTLDPERFQYKASEAGGVTGALSGVDKWEPALANPITAWKSNDGKTYVVNGHQRFDLATRAEAGGQQGVAMPARVFNESDGFTPEYMKALGARQNIAEGSGTAIDAAKILRSGEIPDHDKLPGLNPRSQLVQDARGLAALDPQAFGMVENDLVPQSFAAQVGHQISDPKDQLAAMGELAKNPPANAEQARIMVQDIKNSGFATSSQIGLFGEEQISQSLFAERARILDNTLRQLRQNKTAFKVAVNSEETLTEAGNKLSRKSNEKAQASNEKIIAELQANGTRKGAISDALSDAARQLKDGKPIATVSKDFLARTRELIARGGFEELQPGDNAGRNEPSGGRAAPAGNLSTVESDAQAAKQLVGNPEQLTPDRIVAQGLAKDKETMQYQAEGATKEQLFKLAAQLKPTYESFVKDVTQNIKGAEPYQEGVGGISGVRIKKRAGRIDEKIADKKGNAGAVSDYLGGAIEVANPEAMREVINRIQASGYKILEVEDMLTGDDKTKNDGYRAIHMQVELQPGFSAELQIIPKSIAKIKETLHPEYVKLRDAEGNETPASEAARQKMVGEYQKAFDKFKGAGQTELDVAGKPGEQLAAAREGRIAPKVGQQAPGSDGGLFDEGARKQDDMFMQHPERGAIDLTPKPEVVRTDAENKILDKISVDGEKPNRPAFSWNDFYTAAVDKLDPIRRINEAMDKGLFPSALQDSYKLMRNLAGNFGRAQAFIENHTYDFGTYKNTGKSLKEILEPVKDDLNGFRAYAASRRAIELEARDINSGMDAGAAKQVIAEGAEKYEPIFKELSTYQDAVLKYLKDSGVVTDEQLAGMRGANKAYVPFYRVMDDESVGLGGNKVKNPIKRIKGSDRDIVDPIESIVRNTYSYIGIAERNAAAKSFFDLASKQEKPEEYFTKSQPFIKPTKVSDEEMSAFLKKEGIEDMPENTMTVFRAMRTPLAKDEVGFFNQGKWTVMKVDPDLAEAFNGTPRAQHGFLFSMLAAPAKMLRYGLVTPEFILRHLERNTLSATIIGDKAKIPFENLYKGIFSYINKDEAYENWLKSGGKVSALSGLTRDDVQDQMRRITDENPAANFLQKTWNIAKTPFDMIHALQQNLENMQRLGAYKTAMQGLDVNKESVIDAGYYARNVAPDPSRIGKDTGLWNAVTALANTEIQHSAQLLDAFRTRPIPTLAKGFALVTLPTIINWAYNHNSDSWKETPDWERDAFWIVPAGNYTMRIPKPFLMGFLFATVPERILDAISGNDKEGKGLEAGFKDMFEQATPNVIPTALVPIIDQITNHSMFRGTPLVPDHLMQQLPEYRYTEYTSELTKALGKLVGKVPFIGATSMASPVVIDNYLRAWAGSLGTYVYQGADAALRKAGVLPDPLLPTSTLADIPFVKAFVVRYPSATAESIQEFQNSYRDMSQVTNTFKALIKQGEIGQAQQVMANNPQAFFKLDQINKTLNEQNQLVHTLYKNPDIKPDEKRQIIDGIYYQMIQISRAGNNIIDALKQQPSATKH